MNSENSKISQTGFSLQLINTGNYLLFETAILCHNGKLIVNADCEAETLVQVLNLATLEDKSLHKYYFHEPLELSVFNAILIADMLKSVELFNIMDYEHKTLISMWTKKDIIHRLYGGIGIIQYHLGESTPADLREFEKAFERQRSVFTDRKMAIEEMFYDPAEEDDDEDIPF